jgi:DNA repair protein RadC
MAGKDNSRKRGEPDPAAAPHYHGHRQRLRERLLQAGTDGVRDYELLELILFRAIPQRDVKPLAKTLIERFGSFAEAIAAPIERLREVKGLGEAAITELKVVQAAAGQFARGQTRKRTALSSWSSVLDYCRTAMAFADREQFRILFLDKRNQLIADEVLGTAPSITRRSIRARWSSARSNCPRPRSSWCTIIRPAIRRRRRPTSR